MLPGCSANARDLPQDSTFASPDQDKWVDCLDVLDLFVALPHDVDVFNVKEDKLEVLVIVLTLVTSSLQPHCFSIHLDTSLNNFLN